MFEIGQKVVCVKAHSSGKIKEGEVYTVKNMELCLECKSLMLDVGVKSSIKDTVCINCGNSWEDDGTWFFSHTRFKPLDDLYNEEIEELMNEVNQEQPFEL
jgi:hypothetical protein